MQMALQPVDNIEGEREDVDLPMVMGIYGRRCGRRLAQRATTYAMESVSASVDGEVSVWTRPVAEELRVRQWKGKVMWLVQEWPTTVVRDREINVPFSDVLFFCC